VSWRVPDVTVRAAKLVTVGELGSREASIDGNCVEPILTLSWMAAHQKGGRMANSCDGCCDNYSKLLEWEGQYYCWSCWEDLVAQEIGSGPEHCGECGRKPMFIRPPLPAPWPHTGEEYQSLCWSCWKRFAATGRRLSDYNEAIWRLVNGLDRVG
jgi:DNA-directed RNA polymerase subunit RPC12/RpoP